MEEIEVGEYVRTKRGISKVLLEVKTVQPKMYGKHDIAYLINKCPRMYITETGFIKHSKNIIDLIEVRRYSPYRRCSSRRYSLYNDRKIFKANKRRYK